MRVNVPVQMLTEILTEGEKFPRLRCVKGLPANAELMHVEYRAGDPCITLMFKGPDEQRVLAFKPYSMWGDT